MKKTNVTLIVTQKVEYCYYYFLKERTPLLCIDTWNQIKSTVESLAWRYQMLKELSKNILMEMFSLSLFTSGQLF